MDTILSIDLDILMSPYCGIYNELVNPDEDRQYNWHKIEKIIDVSDFTINQEYKEIIQNIINKYSMEVDTIYVGYDHSTILNAIQMEKNNLNSDYKFDLYNIDYHHDIYYDDYQKEMIIEQDFACCGNWVGFLAYKNYLNSYYWIKGVGSAYDKDYIKYNDIYIEPNINNLTDKLELNNLKILYIACSYPWFPLNCSQELGDFLLNLPQEKIIYLDGQYSNNHDRKIFLN